MDFKNFIPAIKGILGLSAFNKVDGVETLTEEECAKLREFDFSEKFIGGLKNYLANPEGAPAVGNKPMSVVASLLGQTTDKLQAVSSELDALKASSDKEKTDLTAQITAKEAQISELNDRIKVLASLPEHDPAKDKAGETTGLAFNLMDEKQLGGMPGAEFGLDRAYNLRAKAALLAQKGLSMVVPTASSTDFDTLKQDLGAFYRRPWSERIQSFLVELPTITSLFPTESGHQDLDTLVNLWLGEFSQAENTTGSTFDNVAKGSYDFGTETLRMYGVMFVHRFQDLKELEKTWIGYLNREGSNSVKLSFIEFLLVETAKQLHNEREMRWVNGIRKNPDANTPGRAMEAADGLYEYLRKKIEGHIDFTPNGGTSGQTVYQIKPFELGQITPGNIGEVFYQGTSMIPAQFRDSGKVALYVPSFMIPWYHKYNEMKYGQNTDYRGAINCVKEYPSVRLVAIPNADNHHRIFWTIEGNIKTYDHVAGEMTKFNIEQQDWSLKVWSQWKESIQAVAVGYKYTNKALMDGSRQLIWANEYDRPASYYMEQPHGANPSVALHSSVVIGGGDSVYEITDIADAEVGKVVAIRSGADADHGIKISKKGKFSLISETWTPGLDGVIKLMKRTDGKFIEISRSDSPAGAFEFEADATTPSVAGATVFVTGANTEATAITDLEDAVEGVIYTIHGAGSTNASTIANSGNFVLTSAMTLSAGKFIKLVKAADGKFYEIARG